MKTLNLKMSKISIPFFMFVAIALIITSCQKPQKYFEVDEKARAEMIEHIIPLKDATTQYKDYGKNRVKILKDTLKKKYGKDFNDTRIVSLDIETIKQYLLYVEEQSKELEVEPKSLLFYFGVYSDKDQKAEKKKDHQTFFIAPATSSGDFQSGYTFEIKDEKKQIVYLKDVLKSNEYNSSAKPRAEKASFFSLTQPDEDGLLLNRTGTSPPQ